jgi:hypothetical protein
MTNAVLSIPAAEKFLLAFLFMEIKLPDTIGLELHKLILSLSTTNHVLIAKSQLSFKLN